MKNLLNKRKTCPYFRCHDDVPKEEFDCTFCYCPLYPCGMEETGGKWIDRKNGEKIWDCSGCSTVHRKQVVSKIKESMRLIIKEESENEY